MEKTSFSVVIPTYQRKREVVRAINSVLTQDYDGPFQVIVVDDGSSDGTEDYLKQRFGLMHPVHYVKHEKNLGKTFARNTGLREAKNEFICQLDSDDTYHSSYLSTFAKLIEENPGFNVFTCGAAVYNFKSNHFSTRSVFVPAKGEVFGSGTIGTGSFVYRRSVAPTIPESAQAYGGEESFSAKVQKMFPEIEKMYGKNEQGQWKPFGSPFADDYTQFFMATRDNAVVGINLPLYIQHYRN